MSFEGLTEDELAAASGPGEASVWAPPDAAAPPNAPAGPPPPPLPSAEAPPRAPPPAEGHPPVAAAMSAVFGHFVEDAISGSSAGAPGIPLPPDLASQFAASVGKDLSDVRLHTGSESAAAARGLGAHAWTIGNDIHFGHGRYDPHSGRGRELIAHEAAHVVQQSPEWVAAAGSRG
jgi:uncharacterized protein DUF4157